MMEIKKSVVIRYVLFIISIYILPSLLNTMFQTDSRGRYVVLISVLLCLINLNHIYVTRFTINITLIIISFVAWLSIPPILTPFKFDYSDFYLTFIAWIPFIWSSYIVAKKYSRLSEAQINKIVLIAIWFISSIAFISLTFHKLEFNLFGLSYFPFAEPAHLARLYGVFLVAAMCLRIKHSTRFNLIIISLILAISFPSLSILVYSIVAILVLMLGDNNRSVIIFVALIGLAAIIGYDAIFHFIDYNYFLDRITTPENSDNFTSLVFWQGLEAARLSLIETNFIGIGLHQLGNEPPNEISRIISQLGGGGTSMLYELNRKDGGFVAAKLIAELGVFGILLVILLALLIVKSFKIIGVKNVIIHYRLAAAVVISVAPEIFLRGGGYFSGSLLLLMSAIIYMKIGFGQGDN